MSDFAEKDAPESRARRRIRKAVESRGFKVLSMEYEPWYNAGEMSGITGGWTVLTDRPWEPNTNYGDEACGLSVDEVLAWIDCFFTPGEPCACYPDDRPRRSPLVPLVGDPERPLHEPACGWFIRYRLPYWTRVTPPGSSGQ